MKCNDCGSTNAKDALFCSNCGAKLGLFCPNCGTEIAKDDVFCKKCGSAIKPNKKKPSGKSETPPTGQPPAQPAQKPKKKVPLWLLIVLGGIVVICGLIAVFGGFSFHIGAPAETETPTLPTATITPIIVSTPTPAETPTLEPTPTPSYEPAEASFICEPGNVQFAFEHQPVKVSGTWTAKTEALVADFMEAVQMAINFDGTDIVPLVNFSQPFFNETMNGYQVEFGFESNPLPVGMHIFDATLNFGEKVSDGENQYGPGTQNESFNFQCPLLVGAPDATWETIAQTDFSEEKGLFNTIHNQDDAMVFDSKESENGVFRLSYEPLTTEEGERRLSFNLGPFNTPATKDVIISFDAKILKKAEEAYYGLVLRSSEGEMGGDYYLTISPDTQSVQFLVAAPGSDSYTTLFEGQSPAILPEENNQVTFIANGTSFVLWVNQNFIFFIDDSTIQTAGDVRIRAGVYGMGESVFEFDNLLVRAPVQ